MRWKPLAAVVLVLAIASLLFVTDIGKRYTDFFRFKVGDLISPLLVLFKVKPPSGQQFTIVMSTDLDAFKGKDYKLVNSSLSVNGILDSLKIGTQVIGLKEMGLIDVSLDNIAGDFIILGDGSIRFTGTADAVEVDRLRISGSNTIELSIYPKEFSLNGLYQDKLSFTGVTGEIKRYEGDKTDRVSLDNSRVDIYNFAGSLSYRDQTAVLGGMTNSVSGDKFSFV